MSILLRRCATLTFVPLAWLGCEDGGTVAKPERVVSDQQPAMCGVEPEPAPTPSEVPCGEDQAEDEVATDGATPAACCGAPRCRGVQSGCSCGGKHALCEG